MRVLVACEFSGTVREAFRLRGHDAWSCDLLPAEDGSPYHLEGNALWWLTGESALPWDLLIAHPPCTYLSSSGLHWNTRRPERQAETVAATRFVLALAHAPVERIAIENPVGRLSTAWRKPDQIIQPWMFGHDASKKTCLWLKNLPCLWATKTLTKHLYANQTPSGQNKLGPSPTRARERSRTYSGIAGAMADQWGN